MQKSRPEKCSLTKGTILNLREHVPLEFPNVPLEFSNVPLAKSCRKRSGIELILEGTGPQPSWAKSYNQSEALSARFECRNHDRKNVPLEFSNVPLELECFLSKGTFLIAEISLSECADCHSVVFCASPVVHTMVP